MNRLLCVILIGFLVPSQSQALSLLCEPSNDFSKHASEVSIAFKWDVDTWAISIDAPSSIDGLPLSLIQISKGKNGSILSAHLRADKRGANIESHFYASEKMLKGMLLMLAYGEECRKGFSVPLINDQLH